MPTEERVAAFGKQPIIEQFESLALKDFQQELECTFVDESYSYHAYDLILPNTSDELVLADDFTDIPEPEGRIVAGFDVGRTRDRSELAVFEETSGRFTCRLLRTYAEAPFAEQEADLRRLLEVLPVARLSIDRSGIGMNLAENLTRDLPQVVAENLTNEAKERWATDFKITLQRREVVLPRDREVVGRCTRSRSACFHRGRWRSMRNARRAAGTRRGSGRSRWRVSGRGLRGRGGGGMKIGVRVIG